MAAVSDEVLGNAYDVAWWGFMAGFDHSGEGWNAEWPFEHKTPEEKRHALRPFFEKWYAAHAPRPATSEERVELALQK